jgi:hypothetical protein
MNVGELKKSLSRFPPDMDDADVLLVPHGWDSVEILAFTGQSAMGEKVYLVLGTTDTLKKIHILNPPNIPI